MGNGVKMNQVRGIDLLIPATSRYTPVDCAASQPLRTCSTRNPQQCELCLCGWMGYYTVILGDKPAQHRRLLERQG
jgi:hypothetical protein